MFSEVSGINSLGCVACGWGRGWGEEGRLYYPSPTVECSSVNRGVLLVLPTLVF